MAQSHPYQPLLFRLLHNINAVLILSAFITGFWVYNTYDGRWGKLPLPEITGIISIHGTLALGFFIIIPWFTIYSFHPGKKRLLQPNSLQYLGKFNQPIGWYSLHRLINTIMLVAATLAAFSGRTIKEEWLPNGELDHSWYFLHLIAWCIMGICIGIHLLSIAKVGGLSLMLSIIDLTIRPQDSPRHWKQHILNWLTQQKSRFISRR